MRPREQMRCDICGGEIRSVADTELLDGHICPQCAEKLSPWFTDDLDCTEVVEIKRQIQGRKENQKLLGDFHPTRQFGFDTKILVDDDARTFLVTETGDLMAENPDILRIDDVSFCSVDPEEDYADVGPGQFRYRYTFQVDISMDHPYIDSIQFPLNEEPLEYMSGTKKGFLGFGGFDPEGQEDYDALTALGEKIENVLNDDDDGTDDEKYRVKGNPYAIREEPKSTVQLGEGGTFVPNQVVTCPWCGSKTRVTERFCCEHCGGNL